MSFRRLALRLAFMAATSALLVELALRAILFAAAFDGTAVATRLRQPDAYAGAQDDDLHWLLRARWSAEAPRVTPGHDARFGWLRADVSAPALDHADRARLFGRRPVLLFGDSYAQGNTPTLDCFQELLEEHELGETHRILNYGVGGYGLDQTWLLMHTALDVWAAERPLVLVGILVDDDLDRAVLSMRDWPKPRLRLAAGRLLVPDQPVPASPPERLPWVWSYAWKRMSRGSGESAALREEKQALATALLAAIEAELDSRGIPHAYILFHAEAATGDPERTGWRDAFVRTQLDALGARWFAARDELLAESARGGSPIAACFGREGALAGHYNARGNELATRTLARAIASLEGREVPEPPPLRAARPSGELAGEGGVARFAWSLLAPPFELPAEATRLELVPSRGTEESAGAVELHYEPRGLARSFRARLRHLRPVRSREDCGVVRVTLLADGLVLLSRTLEPQAPPEWIEVDLAGRERLTVRVDDGGDGGTCDRVVLGSPRFR